MLVLLLARPAWSAVTCQFPAGPTPSAAAPAAIAADSRTGLLYLVHRRFYSAEGINPDLLPSDLVQVVDPRNKTILATIPVGRGLNGVDQGVALDAGRGRLFVTNYDDDTVSVIDTATRRVIATPAVGRGPRSVAVDPQTGLAGVANSSGGSISVLDASGSVVRTIALDARPQAISFDPVARVAVVLTTAGAGLRAVDLASGVVAGSIDIPFGFQVRRLAIGADSRIYVTRGTAEIIVYRYNAGRFSETSRINPDETADASGVAVDPGSGNLYVVQGGNTNASVAIFGPGGNKIRTVAAQRLPTDVAIDSAARRAYVINTASNSVSVFDTASSTVVDYIPLATVLDHLAWHPRTGRLFAANNWADSVSVLDPATGRVLAYWPVNSPRALAIDPDIDQLYVLSGRGVAPHSLLILDTNTGEQKAAIDVGMVNPGRLVVNTASHSVYVTTLAGLQIIDGAARRLAPAVELGNRPAGIAVDETRGLIYVANQQSGTISVVSQAGRVIETWRPRLGNVWGLAVDPASRQLYVTVLPNLIGDPRGLLVLNAATGAEIAFVEFGRLPQEVILDRASNRVFVTDVEESMLYTIEGATRAVSGRDPVGRLPLGLAWDAAAGRVYVGNTGDGTINCVTPGAAAPPQCTFNVAPAQPSPCTGGEARVAVTAGPACRWTASSNAAWITIVSGTEGTGNGAVTYRVEPNPGSTARSGTLTIAGQTVSLTQSGCAAIAPQPIACPGSVTGRLTAASSTQGSRGPNYYADLYTFTGVSGQRLTVTLTSADFDTYLVLVAPSGAVAATNDDSGPDTSNSRIEFTLNESGGWRIEATSYNQRATGSYTLTVSGCSEGGETACSTRPLSCQPAAGRLSADSCARGQRGSSYYTDVYTFTGRAGQTVTISLESSDFDSYLTLIGPSGAVAATNDDAAANNSNSRIQYTLPTAGTWRVEASSYNQRATGAYTITMSGCEIPESGPCPARSIACPGNASGTLSTSSCTRGRRGVDYYTEALTFTGVQGQRVSLRLSSSDFDPYLYLIAPDGTVAAENDDSGGARDSQINFTLNAGGTWRIEVTSFAARTTGSYTLTFSGCVEVTPSLCDAQPITCPLTTTDRLGASSCQRGVRGAGYYAKAYSFTGTQGSTVTIRLDSSDFDTVLYLVSPAGEITVNDDFGGSSNSRIELRLTSSGTWRIEATSYDPGRIGVFTLAVNGCGLADAGSDQRPARERGSPAISGLEHHLEWARKQPGISKKQLAQWTGLLASAGGEKALDALVRLAMADFERFGWALPEALAASGDRADAVELARRVAGRASRQVAAVLEAWIESEPAASQCGGQGSLSGSLAPVFR
ncbi:MAG: pre-peptidase C-terminal domain-containing protein [Acidobacteria bacterium]|nr:pre-peptidase C-terminal domain-containing protein [Acidobacteriota bacterium]